MEYVKLNNGVEMPILGFGVYQIPKEEIKRCVLDAIKVGFRSIDTAQSYFNESEVGDALLECGIPREELFITTKVWIDNYGYEKCKESVLESLKKLKTDYIDLVLLQKKGDLLQDVPKDVNIYEKDYVIEGIIEGTLDEKNRLESLQKKHQVYLVISVDDLRKDSSLAHWEVVVK